MLPRRATRAMDAMRASLKKKTDSSLFSKEAHFMGEAEEWVLQGFGGRGALVRLPAHHPSQQVDEFSEE